MTRTLIARATVIAALAVAACAAAMPASAQSLGAVAQKEAARRKAVKGPVAVVTNEDLKVVPPAAPPPAGGDAQAAPAAAEAPAEAAAEKDEPQAQDPAKDPEYWRKRIADLRERRDRNTYLMESVQSRINALTTDFYARDDPYQRAKVGDDRQKALAELQRMKLEQATLDKQLADLEEEARRANVPPGWLR
jgi:hypothetical protein